MAVYTGEVETNLSCSLTNKQGRRLPCSASTSWICQSARKGLVGKEDHEDGVVT